MCVCVVCVHQLCDAVLSDEICRQSTSPCLQLAMMMMVMVLMIN